MVYEADAPGRLEILVEEGETVPLGHAIAVIGERAAVEAPPPTRRRPAAPRRRRRRGRRCVARRCVARGTAHGGIARHRPAVRGGLRFAPPRPEGRRPRLGPADGRRCAVGPAGAVVQRHGAQGLRPGAAGVPARQRLLPDGVFELFCRVNVGMAVAAQDALVVPTVHDADTKTPGHIARETRRLADSVRSGTVTPAKSTHHFPRCRSGCRRDLGDTVRARWGRRAPRRDRSRTPRRPGSDGGLKHRRPNAD